MKHLKIFESYIPNNLSYCTDCKQLKKTDDEYEKCIYCRVLSVLGKNHEYDEENIFGQLKYRMDFLRDKSGLLKYINELKVKYNLTEDQVEEIKNILNL